MNERVEKQSVANTSLIILNICVLDDLSEYLNEDYLCTIVGKLQPNLCTQYVCDKTLPHMHIQNLLSYSIRFLSRHRSALWRSIVEL